MFRKFAYPPLALAALYLLALGDAAAAPVKNEHAKQSARPAINCKSASSALNRALCSDPALLDNAIWMAELVSQSLDGANGATRQAFLRDQRIFGRERAKCLPAVAAPATPQPLPGPATETTPADAPPTTAGLPPSKTQPLPASDKPSAAKETAPVSTIPQPSADSAAAAAPDATPAAPADDSGPSPEQMVACLKPLYAARIEALEAPLRRFVDLSADVPTAATVCTAVATLNTQGKRRLLSLHGATLIPVDEVNEMHPSVRMEHLQRYLTPAAMKDAVANSPAWQSQMGTVQIFRIALAPGEPKYWAFSTVTGDNRDRTVLLFESTPDNSRADRMAYSLGGPGTGSFTLMFVRFKGQTYAVESPADGAAQPAVYALDQSKPVCAGR